MILANVTRLIYQRLTDAKEMVQQNLKEDQYKQKIWYDKRAREEHFKHSDKVLVLLPTCKEKLLLKWKGSYQVLEKI